MSSQGWESLPYLSIEINAPFSSVVPHQSLSHFTLASTFLPSPTSLPQISTFSPFPKSDLTWSEFRPFRVMLFVNTYANPATWHTTTMLLGMVVSQHTLYWQVLLALGPGCVWHSNSSQTRPRLQRAEGRTLWRLPCFSPPCTEQSLMGVSGSLWHCHLWMKAA